MQAAYKLQDFWNGIGIPENLKRYRAPESCGQEPSYLDIAKDKRINMNHEELEQSNDIYNAEIAIRDLKKRWHHKTVSNNFPRRVWEIGLKRAAKFIQMITSVKLNGRTPIEAVMG